MKLTRLIFAASASILAGAAFGAGYQIVEQGADNMGTAMAGATVNANNSASAAFWNPSALSFADLKKGEGIVSVGGIAVLPSLSMQDHGSTGIMGDGKNGDCDVDSYVPNFYAGYKFAEDFIATLSITAPWGLESKYDSDWYGRNQGIRSFLMTADINPSVAWKINDWLSICGGVSAQYGFCSLSQWVPMANYTLKLKGDSWSVGGNIGFTIQYAEDGRFGFMWRSAVDHTLTGHAYIDGNKMYSIEADMHMPDTFTVGFYQRLRGKFDMLAIMADYSYIRWSVFEDLTVKGLPQAVSIKEDWRDTSRVSAGLHLYAVEDLILRLGVCYDQSPVKSPKHRTPRIPCADRLWISCGAGYTYENWTFDIAYTYIIVFGNRDIDRNENGVHLKGEYAAHINVIGVSANYKF